MPRMTHESYRAAIEAGAPVITKAETTIRSLLRAANELGGEKKINDRQVSIPVAGMVGDWELSEVLEGIDRSGIRRSEYTVTRDGAFWILTLA